MAPRGLGLEAEPELLAAHAPGRRDIGELQKGKGPRAVPGGNSGFAGRGNVTCRVCLPPARREVRREREREVWRAGVPADRRRRPDSLTCGAPGNPGPPAAGVRARGRASAGHSTRSSRVRVARRVQVPTPAGAQRAPGLSAGGGAARWSPGQPRRRPRPRPPPAPPWRLERQGAGPRPAWGGGVPSSAGGLPGSGLPSPVSERRSKFRKLFYVHLICKHR